MNYKSLFINLLKMLVSGTITFVICWICAVEYDKFVQLPMIPFEAIKIILIAIICLGVYVPLNLLFKMEYAGELFNRLSARFCRK
jgi:hypothetical protein